MAEGDRLGGLQMRVARHQKRGVLSGLIEKRLLQSLEIAIERRNRATQPQAQIGCDLIVARARGVQPPGGIANQGLEPRLDIHMDVFKFGQKFKAIRCRSRA